MPSGSDRGKHKFRTVPSSHLLKDLRAHPLQRTSQRGYPPGVPKRRSSWKRNSRTLARERRRLRRRRRGLPPALVAPAVCARRTRGWIAIVSGLWAAAVITDVALTRSLSLNASYTLWAMLAGVIAGGMLLPLWYGSCMEVHLTVKARTRLLTARTLSGTRTLDLNRLVSVRRFETIGRYGDLIDELHLRDEHGVRLVVDGQSHSIDTAIRRCVESAPSRTDSPTIKVTKHAQSRLGLAPQPRLRQRILYRMYGFALLMAALCGPGLGSFALAATLSGPGA